MKIRFVSDTHLGLQRQSHTTPESAKRMQQVLHGAAMEATTPVEGTIVIHAGDLFNKYSNSEAVIAQGFELADRCNFVLAGNHDCSNREGTVSSLGLVGDQINQTLVVFQTHRHITDDGTVIVFVPHQMSQTDFALQINEAVDTFKYMQNTDVLKILVTHCNYDNPLTEKSESSLNLTRDQATKLLETFDFIFLGHEHNPRTDFDGRLVVLGSLMPTSFSDISDKYQWELDTETREVSRKVVWAKHKFHLQVDWKEVEPDFFVWTEEIQFIDVTGTATPSQMPEVAKAIHDLWANGPNLLMVRNNVKVEGEEAVAVSEAHKYVNVVDRVRAELTGTGMGVRFEGYL